MSFRCELHSHTREVSPCGRLRAAELVDRHKQAGYAGLVITDHFTSTVPAFSSRDWSTCIDRYLKGFRKARRRGNQIGLSVYFGIELTFTADRETSYLNDFLIYGIDEDFLLDNPKLYDRNQDTVFALVREQGALVIQAHPFRAKCRVVDPTTIDGVEVHNGNPRQTSNNEMAKAFADEHGLLQTSGSDAHQKQDIGNGGVYLPQLPADNLQLAEYLRAQPEMILPTSPEKIRI